MPDNTFTLEFSALSRNESFARVAAAAFASQLNPTVVELTDLKTAISEAVTNAIIHGYENKGGVVRLSCSITDRTLTAEVSDTGVGITDIAQAMEALYTSRPEEERSGMGFTVMETFMDGVSVYSTPGEGTRVVMKKRFV